MIKRIAVIGSGISGLVSACLLSNQYEITLFEANDYLGGHTHTVDVQLDDINYAVDTGFIVFNQQTYPHFFRLIQQYQIPFQLSEMSFSFRSDRHAIEYNGNNLNTLFADRRNLFKPRFYRLLKDIVRFNHHAKKYIKTNNHTDTIKDFAKAGRYNSLFLNAYLEPMIAAIWSKNTSKVWESPAHSLLNFFNHHGLLNVNQRPPWYTIVGGSRNYIPYLIKNFEKNIYLNTKIEKITRHAQRVTLHTKYDKEHFDAVVIATHSDQALQMLEQPTHAENAILSAITYAENEAILHTDANLLPKKALAWASWNYYDVDSLQPTLTYYLNRLHQFVAPKPICLSVNLHEHIKPHKIIQRFSYAHPIFDHSALEAQKKHNEINGKNRTYYCGAYWGYGFHEDGVRSALAVCRELGIEQWP